MNTYVNVVQAELFKAIRKRRFYVLAFLMWVVYPLVALLIGWILQSNVEGTFADPEFAALGVRDVIQTLASPVAITRNSLFLLGNLSPNMLLVIVALFATLFIAGERSQNMWKTILTAAPNRMLVMSGKLTTAMILLFVLLIGNYLSGPVFGGIGTLFLGTHWGGDWANLGRLYLIQWGFGFAAMLFAFMVLWFIRNSFLGGVTVILLPGFLEGAYTAYRTIVGFERLNRVNAFFQAMRIRNTLEDLPRYFFTSNLFAPSREPVSQVAAIFGANPTADGQIFGSDSPFANFLAIDVNRSAWVMVVYGLIFAAILFWSFRQRDIA